MRWIIAGLTVAGVLCTIACVAQNSTNTPPSSSKPEADSGAGDGNSDTIFKEGNAVRVGNTSYTVQRSWWSSRLSHNQFLDRPPNAKYLFVELTVRNNDTKARRIPRLTLIDERGAEYQSSDNGWALDRSFGVLESLNPSVSKQGVVVFDVPPNRGYRLKLPGVESHVQLAAALTSAQRRAARKAEEGAKERAEAWRQRQADKWRAEEEAAQAEAEAQAEEARYRTWYAATGGFTVEAIFVKASAGKVTLRKRGGKEITLPMDRLSEADQEWVKRPDKRAEIDGAE